MDANRKNTVLCFIWICLFVACDKRDPVIINFSFFQENDIALNANLPSKTIGLVDVTDETIVYRIGQKNYRFTGFYEQNNDSIPVEILLTTENDVIVDVYCKLKSDSANIDKVLQELYSNYSFQPKSLSKKGNVFSQVCKSKLFTIEITLFGNDDKHTSIAVLARLNRIE